MSEDLLNAVQTLIDRFPLKQFDPSDKMASKRYLRLYIEDLEDLPEPLVVAAIVRLRRSSTFMPAVAEIRHLVIEACCNLPGEEDAWLEVRKAIAASFPGADPNPWDAVTPLVREVARVIGTHEIKTDEKGQASRRFRDLYRDRRAKHIADLQSGAVALDAAVLGGAEIVQLPRKVS